MGEQNLDRYWKTVVDTIQDGVMIVDTDGTIVSVNRGFEEITGYGADDILGRSCAVLSCSSCELIREQQGCHFCVMFQRGHLRKQRCTLTRKDGTVRYVVKNASVLKDHEGNITGAVETLADVTELIDKEALIESFRRELEGADRFHGMIGTSAAMQKVFEMITNTAQSDAPVIIHGESGTGKELVAQAIHEASRRAKKPFVKVNCAAMNESLLESELFGHVKGAFTGAHRAREGRFEAADGGNLFLDEIGDLPLPLQVKLLTFLDDRVVFPLGSTKAVAANVRIIAATHLDLEQMVRDGRFRQDLYFRLNVVRIHLPALREREGDIALLIGHFLNSLIGKLGRDIKGLSRQAQRLLNDYDYPGNVRELMNILEYSVNVCKGQTVQVDDLPAYLTPKGAAGRPPLSPRPAVPLGQSHGPVPDQHQQPSGDGGKWPQMERQLILNALTRTGGRKSQAAALLGWSRITFWRKMKAHGVNP